MVFRVRAGSLTSSKRYRSRREGRAINTNVIAGRIVQIISIVCPSSKKRLIKGLKNIVVMTYLTKVVIIIKIKRA